MKKLVVNDLHVGVLRSGGTTPLSAFALRQYLLGQIRGFLMQHQDKDLIINGDVFNAFEVPLADVWALYAILTDWLAGPGTLTIGQGNHDIAKDNAKMSAFTLLCNLLKMAYPERVRVVVTPTMIFPGLYMIPHMPNQALFDVALAGVPIDAKLVFLHANYDNGYTLESDHSLNVSPEQAQLATANGAALIFGHEHQARTALRGQVFITGNQWPTSVADCLRNPHGRKHAHVLDGPDESGDYEITPIITWDAEKSFGNLSWDTLLTDATPYDFVRVSGNAAAVQAADVIGAIAKYRQTSQAYVVTNAVAIEGVAVMADLPATVENIKAFDVLAYLYENLEPVQAEVVQRLIAKRRAGQMQEAA